MAGWWCEEAVALLRRPAVAEMAVDVLLCAVPIWAAVMIGLALGWSWRPRWTGLLFLGLRSRLRVLWLWVPPGLGARRLWLACTALSACSVAPRLLSSAFRRRRRRGKHQDKVSPDKDHAAAAPGGGGCADGRTIFEGEHDTVTEKDLEHLLQLLDNKESGDTAWQNLMERTTSNMTYKAWRREPEEGPIMHCSRTIFEDATPELVRDFFWDGDFRLKWDPMLAYSKTLDEFPQSGATIVHWIKKFPFFCSDREYIFGGRIWESGKTYYCVTKVSVYLSFATFVRQLGFVASTSDTSLFILREGTSLAYLLLYVDDIILTASSSALLQRIMTRLRSEFAMTDLGALHHFLGIAVMRSSDGLFLSQRQYAVELLQRAGMAECHPTSTPVDTHAKLSATDGDLLSEKDASEYRSLAGALQYLTLTRPDLAYAVQQVCLFMHAPREPHRALIKRILRFVQGTLSSGLHIGTGPVDKLTAYSDADWAGCPDSRRSTSGFCVYLGDTLVSWSSKRQTTVSRSSAEAEYRAVAHVVAECCWLRQLLQELHIRLPSATIVFCNNVSAVYMTANPVHHKRTKHIEIDIHFVREKVALGEIRVLHVPSSHQFADIMTKGLPTALFREFRSSLCVREPPAATAGGC